MSTSVQIHSGYRTTSDVEDLLLDKGTELRLKPALKKRELVCGTVDDGRNPKQPPGIYKTL